MTVRPVSLALSRDLREIRDLAGRRADAGEQRQPVGADGDILIVHENAFEE